MPRRARGDAAGTRALIEVLWLHRRLPAVAVAAGMRAALRVGSTDPAVVAIEARRWADGHGDDPASQQRRRFATVIELPTALPGAQRSAPRLDGYDQLLSGVIAADVTSAQVAP